MNKTKLYEALTEDEFTYDASWGIWAEAPFTRASDCRIGEVQFENGGILDDMEFFTTFDHIVEARSLDAEDKEDLDWENLSEDDRQYREERYRMEAVDFLIDECEVMREERVEIEKMKRQSLVDWQARQ